MHSILWLVLLRSCSAGAANVQSAPRNVFRLQDALQLG
jgi:hypothetical protein